jgi:hypothetical protein
MDLGKRITIRTKKGEKGIAIIWLAMLLLPLILAFAGLAVDIAYMYTVKNSLQVSADSAALAGAALIGNANDLAQSAARTEALDYAAKNTAAGKPVVLASDGGNTLSSGNDITVGFWDGKSGTYTADKTPVNAVEVRPRRSEDSPGGPASVFWGPILSFFGEGWSFMSAASDAIAVRKSLTTPGISLCIMSCDPSPVTGTFIINTEGQTVPIDNGMAWTVFDCGASVNANDIKDYIWGRKSAPYPLCGRCITTQNGVSALSGNDGFDEAFESTTYDRANKTFDTSGHVTSWKVAVPIIDNRCDSFDGNCNLGSLGTSGTCPPGVSGMGTSEPSRVAKMAVVTITAVITTGSQKGVTISESQCIPCDTPVPFGKDVVLVK